MKTITTLLVCISLQSFGMMPTSPYRFYEPDFEGLMPFSKKELAIMKEKKIKKISQKNDFYTIDYYLNNDGKITHELVYQLKKKKKIIVDSVSYTYNSNGLLILKKSIGHINSYDSIAYTTGNRVIYYLSYQINNKGKKNEDKVIYWDLHLTKQTDKEIILTDNHDTTFVRELTFDENNNAIKLINNTSSDSVAINKIDNNTYTKNYYFKDNINHYTYTLGQTNEYKNGLLRVYTIYDKIGGGNIVSMRRHYTYDEQSNLIQIINDNHYQSKYLYTHNEDGLLLDEVVVNSSNVNVTRYSYVYN